MVLQFNPLALVLLISSMVIIVMAVLARDRTHGRAITLFLVFMFSAAGLNLAYALELLSANLPSIMFWVKTQYLFLYLPALWLFFILTYTGHERYLTRRNVILVLIPSTLYTLMVWTNGYHHLNWTTVGTITIDSHVMFDRTYGPVFYLGMGYAYLIMLVAFVTMIAFMRRSQSLYRNQIRLLLVGAALPLVGNFITIAGLSPYPKLDLMPIGYVLGCLPMAWSLFRHRLLDLVPLAHEQIIGGMDDLVLVTDTHRQIVNANPAAAQWLGYPSPDDLIGMDLGVVLPRTTGEITLDSTDARCDFEPRLSSFYDQQGQQRGYVIVLRDVTERKQAQETIQQYADELEVRNRELNAFSHTIAHDLKNPVTNLDMIAQVLLFQSSHDALDSAYLQEKLHDIQIVTHKMNQMIEGLLLLARLPESDIIATQVEMSQVVESAIHRFQHELSQRAITIEVEGALPPVCGYDIWLEEVVANLISNAIKYMGNGNPQPQITIRGYLQDSKVRYEVCDNGVGIPTEHQAQLFEMFSRFHENEAAGLGIGLSIVLRIITRLNGEVGLESEVGQGSTFWFTLPTQTTLSPAAAAGTG